MAHPELTDEPRHHAVGNYALLDQPVALIWVKANIAAGVRGHGPLLRETGATSSKLPILAIDLACFFAGSRPIDVATSV